MLDSVHLARWLSQFGNSNLQISIFPSTRFRKLHPDIRHMIENRQIILYSRFFSRRLRLAGYLDFVKFEGIGTRVSRFSRSKALDKYIAKLNPSILHLVELQHAGYLYLDSKASQEPKFKVISTNYGSDLMYFISSPDHKERLINLLRHSDYYSAECRRDYELARSLGFNGIELPLMPNSGGFNHDVLNQQIVPLRDRKTIYIKGYGGKFGLGKLSLEVANQLLDSFTEYQVVVVSLTEDLREIANEIEQNHKGRIKIFGIRDQLDREQILRMLRESILCIGASRSDGISTTFLEALVSGAVAIQTDTSCANEWVQKGFFAKVVPASREDIMSAAEEILLNYEHYDAAIKNNIILSKKFLSFSALSSVAQVFYESDMRVSQ